MKILFILLCTLVTLISTDVYSQIHYYGDVFTYDAAGNRIKREYIWTIVAPKGSGPEQPVDTLMQQFKKEEITVRAYPNPVADQMVVENLSWKDNYKATVEIFDITGKAIQSRSFSSSKEYFSLAGLASGMYHVHYYLNSQLLTTWKIVKK